MSGAAPARRTNLALALVAAAATVTVALASAFGDRGSAGATPAPTTGIPTTGTTSPAVISGESWFAPATEDDPSYPMESLSCAAMGAQVRLDLCGVFDGSSGRFMVTAAEAYWDPSEADLDGVVRVPLVVSVYVLSDAGADSVAAPTITGIVAVPYGPAHNELGLYSSVADGGAGGDEVAVLVRTERATLRGDATEQAHVIRYVGPSPVAVSVAVPDAADESGDLRLLNAYAFPRTRNLTDF